MGMSLVTQGKIALRNAIRNRRRSLLTVASVAIGFLALSLFEGYFTYVYNTLADQAVIGERLAHLTITKKDYYVKGSLDPRKYLFSPEEYEKIRVALAQLPGLTLMSPRLHVEGLVSNGEASHIFIGEGVDAQDILTLRGEKYVDLPGKLHLGDDHSAVVGRKLADSLGVKVGDTAVVLTSTADGMVNALDMTVGEISTTGAVGTDDKFLLLPLTLARKLYDFDGADRIAVLLDSLDRVPELKSVIEQQVQNLGIDCEVKEWKELSAYYTQVRGLFDMMYLFLCIVVAGVVMTSVMNTISMSISERTREIGALRALGMRLGSLNRMFVLEGMLLVLAGCLVGLGLTYACAGLINQADITYTPPDSTEKATLIIELVFANLFGSLFTMTLLAALSSYLPARHAARKSIVGALAYV